MHRCGASTYPAPSLELCIYTSLARPPARLPQAWAQGVQGGIAAALQQAPEALRERVQQALAPPLTTKVQRWRQLGMPRPME